MAEGLTASSRELEELRYHLIHLPMVSEANFVGTAKIKVTTATTLIVMMPSFL